MSIKVSDEKRASRIAKASELPDAPVVKDWKWACKKAGIPSSQIVRKTDPDYARVLAIYREGGHVFKKPEPVLSPASQAKRDSWQQACKELSVDPWKAKKGTDEYSLVLNRFIQLVESDKIPLLE